MANVIQTLARRYRRTNERVLGNDEKASGHRIYVGAKGQRYVKAEELLKDPNVKRRLERADRLADKIGLKNKANNS